MKKLLNTLYVTKENAYLGLDGENVIVMCEDTVLGRVPLHTIDSIMTFGYTGASPALMGKCAGLNKPLTFLKPSGAFLARVSGKQYGNILLRKIQFRVCEDKELSLAIAKNIIAAKLNNTAALLRRAVSDHAERINAERVGAAAQAIKAASRACRSAADSATLRGLEGGAANDYFAVFNELILQQKEEFVFKGRNRRPPLDAVNAMLSFGYSLLTSLCVSALEAVGLDPYAGVFHVDRPGRCSLALDLMEEFRAPLVDRFVISRINKRATVLGDFTFKEDGAVILNDDARREFLSAWQLKKQEQLVHPFLKEKVEWGLLPFVQAMLLARYLRGDLDDYPPFVWK